MGVFDITKYGLVRSAFVFVAGGALAVLALAASLVGPEVIPKLTRDTAAVAGVHPATGALSNIGAFIWFGTATVLLFTSVTVKRAMRSRVWFFLVSSAVITFYLWADDFFMIHERLSVNLLPSAPIAFHKWFEKGILASILLTTALHILVFKNILLQLPYQIFASALLFLGLSVVVDQTFALLGLDDAEWEYFIEDGAKWIGICLWSLFHVETCVRLSSSDPKIDC
ncbi:hypothetical protein [Qipengyuania atrilutea]|uniref:Uncharacterized protein n=1 Tax=Qipengyuania atrilutea TaxID=2744473 RepID=A0A850GX59_9SPHN|nr:hypothetical protein [Actirhodobacter atriluteus]NVD44141.1 hypothetical protein [Actirhodobacter atriluteus]